MNVVKNIGKLVFEPENRTKKHEKQSSWKRVAMVMFEGDMSEYYAWFIKRRYSIVLQPPLRRAHVTFINDSEGSTNGQWDVVKKKWDGHPIELEFNTDVRTDAEYWWLNVVPNDTLKSIRNELGLGDPYFPFHLTIGYPNNKNEEQSRYIHSLIKKGLVT